MFYFSKKTEQSSRSPKTMMFIPGGEYEAIQPTSNIPAHVQKILSHVNLPKKILNVIIGHDHPIWSRLALGMVLMLTAEFLPDQAVLIRTSAHLIHDAGGIPWIEAFIAVGTNKPIL